MFGRNKELTSEDILLHFLTPWMRVLSANQQCLEDPAFRGAATVDIAIIDEQLLVTKEAIAALISAMKALAEFTKIINSGRLIIHPRMGR